MIPNLGRPLLHSKHFVDAYMIVPMLRKYKVLLMNLYLLISIPFRNTILYSLFIAIYVL